MVKNFYLNIVVVMNFGFVYKVLLCDYVFFFGDFFMYEMNLSFLVNF